MNHWEHPTVQCTFHLTASFHLSLQQWRAVLDDAKKLLNPSKTEFLLLGTPRHLEKAGRLLCLKLSDLLSWLVLLTIWVFLLNPLYLQFTVWMVFLSCHICTVKCISPCFQGSLWQIHWSWVVLNTVTLLLGISESKMLTLWRVQDCLDKAITKVQKYRHGALVPKAFYLLLFSSSCYFKLWLQFIT